MVLFFHNQKLTNLSHADKQFDTLEHTGHVIYRHYYPVGTVLLSQFAQNSLKVDRTAGDYHVYQGTVPLLAELKRIKTGLRFYVDVSHELTIMTTASQFTGKDYALDTLNGAATLNPSTGIVDIPKTSFGTVTHFLTANVIHNDNNGSANYTNTATFEVLVADLQSGKWLAFQDTEDYLGYFGSVKIRTLNDTTIQFESLNGGQNGEITLQSDAVFALGTNFWLIITSVTAY